VRGLCPWRVCLAFLILAVMLYLSIIEKPIPDADDCLARGKSADCWVEAVGD
jgi:hypothetical protein